MGAGTIAKRHQDAPAVVDRSGAEARTTGGGQVGDAPADAVADDANLVAASALVAVLQIVNGDVDVLDEFVVVKRAHVLLHLGHLVVSQLGVGMLAVIERRSNGNVTVAGILVAYLFDVSRNPEGFHYDDNGGEAVAL